MKEIATVLKIKKPKS